MARQTNDTLKPKPPAKPKAEVMTAQPGQLFVAVKDCWIDKCFREGDEVPFAPGQEVPLNLVRLVVAPEQTTPEQTEPDLPDAGQDGGDEGQDVDQAQGDDDGQDLGGDTFQA